jgi:glycosyltransferase involved in cell wall biosynthesis
MDWQASCAAIIPCLNEEATIGKLVGEVRQHVPTVLVVDDGSTDATAVQAEAAGAIILHHDNNQGKGHALREGWRRAREKGFSWALMLDGDGQHAAADIPSFFAAAEKSASLVVGNRMGNADRMPWLRRQVNRWMSRRLSKAAGQFLPDSQCGFRLMNLKAWSALSITVSRFEIESDVLLKFAKAGLVIAFVPIQVIYKEEKSKINPLRDTVRWFRWWKDAKRK